MIHYLIIKILLFVLVSVEYALRIRAQGILSVTAKSSQSNSAEFRYFSFLPSLKFNSVVLSWLSPAFFHSKGRLLSAVLLYERNENISILWIVSNPNSSPLLTCSGMLFGWHIYTTYKFSLGCLDPLLHEHMISAECN